MKRLLGAALAALLLAPVTAGAFAGTHFFVPAPPVIYMIDGFLDQAPTGTSVEERVTIGRGGQSRTFLITSYHRLGSGDPWVLTRDLGLYRPDFILQGQSRAIARLLSAPPGTRVSGTFQLLRGTHTLVVGPDLKID